MAGQSSHQWPVTIDPIYLCWLWTGAINKEGYGVYDGKAAHRVVYESERGPIPDGLMLDHRCRNRACVSPMHTEAVSQSTNEKRKRWAWRVKLKQCQFGHNLYLHGRRTPQGGAICLICG